jgi:hypothetical protein
MSSLIIDPNTLLVVSVITLHDYIHNQEVFDNNILAKELNKLGYPKNSINSMIRCGEVTGEYLVTCKINGRVLKDTHHNCSLRNCYRCSKYRANKIKRKYLDYLRRYKKTHWKRLRFLTICPENYEDLSEGLRDIKENFARFIRRKKIKSKIDGGLVVLEVKQVWKGKPQYDKYGKFLYYHKKDGWNIHLHAIIYGQYLDNRIIKNGDSFLVKEWKDTSRKNVMIDIRQVRTKKDQDDYEGLLDYLTNYISAWKQDFKDDKGLAEYMVATRKRRLISPFGKFFKDKPQPLKKCCPVCGGSDCEITHDHVIIEEFKNQLKKKELKIPKPPPFHYSIIKSDKWLNSLLHS